MCCFFSAIWNFFNYYPYIRLNIHCFRAVWSSGFVFSCYEPEPEPLRWKINFKKSVCLPSVSQFAYLTVHSRMHIFGPTEMWSHSMKHFYKTCFQSYHCVKYMRNQRRWLNFTITHSLFGGSSNCTHSPHDLCSCRCYHMEIAVSATFVFSTAYNREAIRVCF